MFLLKFINPEKYLLKRGAKIGKNFRCNPPVGVADGHLLVIGDNVSLSFNVYFSTHDGSNQVLEYLGFSKPHHLKWGGISIGNNCFIGANSIIMPNVTIGDNCIIGAGSIVTKSFGSNLVIAGNPAKVIMTLDEFKNKNLKSYRPLPKK